MAEFLTTSGISFQIENIIKTSKTSLYLFTPFLKLTKNFFERLKDASERGVVIQIFYGKNELNADEKQKVAQLKNIQLYFSENLHAKCYFNESTMVITSMNMYEFSEKNNREMGILVYKTSDPQIFQDAIAEAKSIKASSKPETLKSNEESGYCIRCHEKINFNPSKPLCFLCYQEWDIWANSSYPEKYCHACGSEFNGTIDDPLCEVCDQAY
jgi:phosphatidylserine/phosphatidylglycerophosphate/cardiolipin synthase-like enzyme